VLIEGLVEIPRGIEGSLRRMLHPIKKEAV